MGNRQRIGILGGTFDPVHCGHIRVGTAALDTGLIDTLLMVPSREKTCSAEAGDRWKMLVSACSRDRRLVPFRYEPDHGNVFSVGALRSLKKEYDGAELFLVVGTDTVMRLREEHRYEDILSLCTFMVCPCGGAADPDAVSQQISRLAAAGGRFVRIPMEPVSVSSAEIRSLLASGDTPPGLDVSVLEYCRCKGLYGAGGRLEHIDDWMDRLFSSLKPRRFAHSLSVASTAVRLAGIHGINVLQAEQAGLLHDCAKCMPMDEMRKIAKKHAITDDKHFLESGALLHAPVGAWVACHRYGMEDRDVLDAIAVHNTGRAGMSRLAMCIALADFMEPLREPFPLLEEVRSLAETSLERALLLSLEGTADYVLSRGLYLHPQTTDTIQWLKSLPAVRETGSAEGMTVQ